MTKLLQAAAAGTLESSDVFIRVEDNADKGLEIHIESVVYVQYGHAIEATVRDVLQEFSVKDARVYVTDKGAIDAVIRARMQTALCRAAHISYDWTKEDEGGAHAK